MSLESSAAAKITIGNVTIEITRAARRLAKGNFVHSLVIAHTADELQGDCPVAMMSRNIAAYRPPPV